jgi:hypothetical protein
MRKCQNTVDGEGYPYCFQCLDEFSRSIVEQHVTADRARIAAAIREEMNASEFNRPTHPTGNILARLLRVVEGG